ncbi:hypothetical protein V5F44_20520 [Xanthobacter sp. V2C-8]|uniref:hypothetical protein n=1 Tax=Xanthobacter albus TaxID=3119929 RepID=UPI0037278154
MSHNPEFTFYVHGRPIGAAADIETTGVSIGMDGQSSLTIFCGDAGLAIAIADGVNSAIERHRQRLLIQPDYSALVQIAPDDDAGRKRTMMLEAAE